MDTVVIDLDSDSQSVLFDRLLAVAGGNDPIIGWAEADPAAAADSDDPYPPEPTPIRGDASEYAHHPLLPLAQAIVWYAHLGEATAVDDHHVRVRAGTNQTVLLDALDAAGASYSLT